MLTHVVSAARFVHGQDLRMRRHIILLHTRDSHESFIGDHAIAARNAFAAVDAAIMPWVMPSYSRATSSRVCQ